MKMGREVKQERRKGLGKSGEEKKSEEEEEREEKRQVKKYINKNKQKREEIEQNMAELMGNPNLKCFSIMNEQIERTRAESQWFVMQDDSRTYNTPFHI